MVRPPRAASHDDLTVERLGQRSQSHLDAALDEVALLLGWVGIEIGPSVCHECVGQRGQISISVMPVSCR